jgi:hypothetical protein
MYIFGITELARIHRNPQEKNRRLFLLWVSNESCLPIRNQFLGVLRTMVTNPRSRFDNREEGFLFLIAAQYLGRCRF